MTFETISYQDQLLTTREQLDVLREYNQECWRGHFSEAELAPALDAMPVIHAEFGSTWKTLEAWRKVYMSRQMTHWNTLPNDSQSFNEYVRVRAQTAHYTPGLHIVRMNLTQGEGIYHDIAEVYAAAEKDPSTLLAHSEGLALVGLHKAFRETDGYANRCTPYLPGYEARNMFVAGSSLTEWNWGPRFDHGRPHEGWGLRMFPTSGCNRIYGPVLLVCNDIESRQ